MGPFRIGPPIGLDHLEIAEEIGELDQTRFGEERKGPLSSLILKGRPPITLKLKLAFDQPTQGLRVRFENAMGLAQDGEVFHMEDFFLLFCEPEEFAGLKPG